MEQIPTRMRPIHFLIRNTDLTRTEEYSAALEVMGWVDCEKLKCKSEKKMVELEGLGLDNSL
jgi:hypothetical protein